MWLCFACLQHPCTIRVGVCRQVQRVHPGVEVVASHEGRPHPCLRRLHRHQCPTPAAAPLPDTRHHPRRRYGIHEKTSCCLLWMLLASPHLMDCRPCLWLVTFACPHSRHALHTLWEECTGIRFSFGHVGSPSPSPIASLCVSTQLTVCWPLVALGCSSFALARQRAQGLHVACRAPGRPCCGASAPRVQPRGRALGRCKFD